MHHLGAIDKRCVRLRYLIGPLYGDGRQILVLKGAASLGRMPKGGDPFLMRRITLAGGTILEGDPAWARGLRYLEGIMRLQDTRGGPNIALPRPPHAYTYRMP